MSDYISTLKKELKKANDTLFARYESLIESEKNKEKNSLADIDEQYRADADKIAAAGVLSRANAARRLADRGLHDSGEGMQTEALYTIGMQNNLGNLKNEAERAKRKISSETEEKILNLSAERDKEYAENEMDIALKAASISAANQSEKKEEEKVEEQADSETNIGRYSPINGFVRYIPAANRVYPKNTSDKVITPEVSADKFLKNMATEYTEETWNGKIVDKVSMRLAINRFLNDTSVSASYRAEVRVLAIALGYL